jgi:hypothetical protein
MKNILLALSLIGGIYAFSQTVESMKENLARQKRDDELLRLVKEIHDSLQARNS